MHYVLPCGTESGRNLVFIKKTKTNFRSLPSPDSLVVGQAFGHRRARNADPGVFTDHSEGHP